MAALHINSNEAINRTLSRYEGGSQFVGLCDIAFLDVLLFC